MLEIAVTPFGLDDAKINVGKVSEDGGITFNWPSVDLSTIENSDLFMSNAKRTLGAQFCNDSQLKLSSESTQVLAIADLSLFKRGKYIGSLYPATDVRLRDNGSLIVIQA